MSVAAPSTRDLLLAWETEAARPSPQRGLGLLTMSDDPPAGTKLLTVGDRDARLLQLRAATFGDEVVGLATCPGCGGEVELAFSIRALLAAAGTTVDEPIALSRGGYDVRARPLTVGDLAAASRATDLAQARQQLLTQTLLECRQDGRPVGFDDVPEDILSALEERLAAADPLADTQLALRCPDCDTTWDEVFDITAFFAAEVDAWAVATLEDVHELAAAYGWAEHQVLDLSRRRRQIYLDLVRA